MPETAPVLNPDDKPIYEALRAAGTPEDLAYTAVQRIRDVAAANLIARFESKLDALSAQQDAKLAALDTKLRMLLWMVPVAVAVIGILVRLWG